MNALAGHREVCEMLGVSKMTLSRWRTDGYFDVEPVAELAAGPVWTAQSVAAWGAEYGRRRGDSPAASAAVPAPDLLLLCLGPCHGEFYLPLEPGERWTCPNDPEHPVAVYAPLRGEDG